MGEQSAGRSAKAAMSSRFHGTRIGMKAPKCVRSGVVGTVTFGQEDWSARRAKWRIQPSSTLSPQ